MIRFIFDSERNSHSANNSIECSIFILCSPESILVNPLDTEVVLVKVTLQQHSLDGVEVRTLQYLVFLEFEEDRVNVVRDSHMMILFVAKLGKNL